MTEGVSQFLRKYISILFVYVLRGSLVLVTEHDSIPPLVWVLTFERTLWEERILLSLVLQKQEFLETCHIMIRLLCSLVLL